MNDFVSRKELTNMLTSPILAEELSLSHGCSYVVVDPNSPGNWQEVPFQSRCPIIALENGSVIPPEAPIDLSCKANQLDDILNAINSQPQASAVACQVLRANESSNISAGLVFESLAYSTLLESGGFQDWLAKRKISENYQTKNSNVIIERERNSLHITLDRPDQHNAYSEELKDKFCGALQLALQDSSIDKVIITGKGQSFCSGGDLNEFGSVKDAANSHLSRTTRSAGSLLAKLKDKTHFKVHGACIGAGIELTAFSNQISAHQNSFFQLPEVGMGLIPGAGGTVSINKRIGRRRTAFMALSGIRIDGETALEWGLIDHLLA